MPLRRFPLVNGQIYHVFNSSLDGKQIFTHKRNALQALNTLSFYRFESVAVRLSYFLCWSKKRKQQWLKRLEKKKRFLVTVICFCLMPNHFHLLLKQEKEDGISKFLSQFQNSFTRYFNTRHKRKGHLFQGQFKAIRIETDEQLVHVSRYIHLNPYSSFVVKNLEDLLFYPWSSFLEYLDKSGGFCNKDYILSQFRDSKHYKKFVLDQADYQRKLEKIKHLALEE